MELALLPCHWSGGTEAASAFQVPDHARHALSQSRVQTGLPKSKFIGSSVLPSRLSRGQPILSAILMVTCGLHAAQKARQRMLWRG